MAGYDKKQVREEMTRLEAMERKLLACGRAYTAQELETLNRLQFLRGLWAARFSNR